MERIFVLLALTSLLSVGFWSASQFVVQAPAFTKSAQVPGILGQTRVFPGRAMYHQGDYLFQTGNGFLQADSLVYEEDGGPDAIAEPEIALARAERARELNEMAISHSPANSHIWSNLAWSWALTGELGKARDAMTVSRSLAPHNLQLAYSRMSFSAFVAEELTEDDAPLSDAEINGTREDYDTLKDLDPMAAAVVKAQPIMAPYLP